MDPQEHIHIISAGDHIHKTYAAVLKDLRTITHTFIFAEKEIYTNSTRDDNKKRAWKCTIREAIDEVNSLSYSRKISCALVPIDTNTFNAIRDPVLGILSEHPNARFSFDISAGSKRLSMGLFAMSLWVDGDSYYAFGNSPTRRVPVPTAPSRNLSANPHYLVILTILFRGQEHNKEERTLMPKETLFNETKNWKVPVQNAKEGAAMQELTPARFSHLIFGLMRLDLIREEEAPEHEQEKLYSITPDGELVLLVYSARMKKRGVASTPDLS